MNLPFELPSIFHEIAIVLAVAAFVGLIALRLRQPLIVAFIFVGILVGPSAFGLVQSEELVEILAEIGIAVLLFLVGLKLDLKLVRTLGPVAVATGLGQVIFTAVFGFLIAWALGINPVTAAYIGVALTFSSTIIIVKLLSDKREIDSLHGRIALGFLIVQDIFVVVAMVALSASGLSLGTEEGTSVLQVILGGIAFLFGVGLFMRFLAAPLMRRVASSPELMLTFAIAWAVLLAAAADVVGFGKELGGLLAGVSLASTAFRDAVASRLSSLRDFLLLFFFIGLGSQMRLDEIGAQVPAAIVLSLFVLIGNPLIVLAIMGYMGYRRRTGFKAGLTVAQISEFSLIFIALGISLGQIESDALSLVTLVGMVTITMSTYMILGSDWLYDKIGRHLTWFERSVPHRENVDDVDPMTRKCPVIIFGLGRFGTEIARSLVDREIEPLGIDFDPEAVRSWTRKGHAAIYGDANDMEFLHTLPLRDTDWVIVTVNHELTSLDRPDTRVVLMEGLREAGYHGKIAITSHRTGEVKMLKREGADCVVLPFQDAAHEAVNRILAIEEPATLS